MKNLLFTLIVLSGLLFSSNAEAQRHNSVFVLRMWDNSMFSVQFDNQYYDAVSNVFRLDPVRPGLHQLVISQRIGYSGQTRIIYRGSINIERNSKVVARVNRYNNLTIEKVVPLGNYNTGGNYSNYTTLPALHVPSLQNTINNTPFDSDRRMIAEQAFASHSYYTDQIIHILRMFSFESTKLKLAKFAYQNCVDKENYYIVNNVFSFSSSIRELNNYIGTYRSPYYDNDWRRDNDWRNNGNSNHNYNNNNSNHNHNHR